MIIDDDEDDIYCINCGEDRPAKLAYIEQTADAEHWRCRTCGEEFSVGLRPDEK